tara:strand:- start:270 stop:1040 length:771 start_codon:yes stop_codon:yes gene_type:complete
MSTYNWSKKFSSIPKSLRKVLAYLAKSIAPNNLNKLYNLLPGINKHINFGHKIHKGANVLETSTLTDLYYIFTSHWQNPTEVVINSKEPGTFLTEFKPDFQNLNNYEKMMALDLITYLPNDILVKVDRTSMASSLEVRAPFLDHNLIEYAWKIPHSLKFRDGKGKWIIRKILNKYVPKDLTERPKMGFGVPLGAWLRGPLKEWGENLLNEKRLLEEGHFNPKLIRDKWQEHLSNKNNWEDDLWNVLMFQAWKDTNK